MRLVLIEWHDSYGCSSAWTQIDGCEPKPMICKSVGWLVHDDEMIKVVVPHVSTGLEGVPSQGCGDMTIPTRAVVRMVDIPESIAA